MIPGAKLLKLGKQSMVQVDDKTDCWNSATAVSASQSENFGGNIGGWNRPLAAGADERSAWSEGAAVNKEEETEGRKKDQNGRWRRARSSENDCGFGWNKVTVEKEGVEGVEIILVGRDLMVGIMKEAIGIQHMVVIRADGMMDQTQVKVGVLMA
ncbi:hypothetical protein NE237_010058 [Protea cynaroides]|uniref:Uncharacterized protein n=1 Tax=Protea cynaroides TaxID=273540 RepID=A0A9Q0KYV1_9MAGN|nr:hypothetical protein NE237_010058 [Protea cynaroides]